MEQDKLREAARLSLGKSRQLRKALMEKAEDLKNGLGESQRNRNASLTARLEEIENHLKQLRLACMEVIFYDFEYAHEKDVEGSLWQAHVVVNAEYRRVVGHINTQNQVVLKRKVDKLYRDFLKTSQFFYRGYIQRLSGQFYIPELQQVARGLEVDPFVTPQQDPAPSATLRTKLVGSCYLTLVRMGDLARYRYQNTEKPPKSSLDIALTYYGLAQMLDPDDGASFHQTAVLYQPSAKHLEIIYYFLRSVCVAKPHKLGAANLGRAFKGLLSHQPGSKGNSKNAPPKDPSEALTTWFLKLHAYYYQGVIFSAREELEKEVLHRLEVCLKAEGNEDLILKMLLANIAACDVAFENIKDTKDWTIERSRSCQYLLFFQVRVTVVLFRLFKSIVQDGATIDTNPEDEANSGTSKSTIEFSPSFIRLLPLIRIYLAWIYVAREDLNRYQEWLEPFIRELYTLVADVLTLLLPHATSNTDVIDSKYLLPEDVEALGLKPLSDRKLPLFLNVQLITKYNPPKCRKTLKPRKATLGVEYSSQIESIWRVRDIICCGVYLAGSAKSPLTIAKSVDNVETWMYLKDGPLKSIDEASMSRMLGQVKMTAHKVFTAGADEQGDFNAGDQESPISPSDPPQISLSASLGHQQDQINFLQAQPTDFLGLPLDKKAKLSYDDEMSADPSMAGMVDKLLDEDEEDDPYAQSSNTHNDTSYGMDSSVAHTVFGNLMPSPVSKALPTAMTSVGSNNKALPNLPWNYFYSPSPAKEPGASHPTIDRLGVPRSVTLEGTLAGTNQQSMNFVNYNNDYNNVASPNAGHFSMYGATQGSAAAVSGSDTRAPADPNNYSADHRAAALDNLKSALFAQYGTGAGSSMQSPSYSYGQPMYANQNDGSRSNQGHRAKTSISSPLADFQTSSVESEQNRDAVSQRFMDLQLGGPRDSIAAQSPIGRSVDMRTEAQLQPISPSRSGYGLIRPDSQGILYNGSAGSPDVGNATFAQQLSAFSGNGSSLAFSNPSSLWAGTPAAPDAPRGTVACNGNFFNATTPFGRSGSVNNRDDPTHFRNRLQELGAGVGESVAAYDRAVLESALADGTNLRSHQQ